MALDDLKLLLTHWIDEKTNDIESILTLARYVHCVDRQDLYIYFTSLWGGLGVIENIKVRFDQTMMPLSSESILTAQEPPLGSDPSLVPPFTALFMNQLEEVCSSQQVKAVLAGNNHGLNKEAFMKEKALYEASPSLEVYLKEYHQRRVQELQDYCDQDKIWFEQKITQETVDFVKANQELLSAVLEDDTLMLTKIPYDPQKYLSTQDPRLKRYYACHCPFARNAILKNNPKISNQWCYCSAGFEKFHFETIMDKQLDVEVLQSALQGDAICRFAIHLHSK